MIKIETNRLMRNIINKIDTQLYNINFKIPEFLKKGIDVNEKGCVVLKKQENYDNHFIDSFGNDLTAFECDVNEFSIEQELDINIVDLEKRVNSGILNGLIQKSLLACEQIFDLFNNKLINPQDQFKIILSIESYDQELNNNSDNCDEIFSTIRFYKIRKNQPWLNENLEIYNQPIMTINFDKMTSKNLFPNWWKTI